MANPLYGQNKFDNIMGSAKLFENNFDYKDIWFVLEDRQCVVDMWRGEGLTCLQVAPGDF